MMFLYILTMQFKRLVKSNLDLAKWAQAAHVPSFEDYMEVGEVEITMYATMAGTLMGMGHIATKEVYEWLKSKPKLIQSLSINGRLMNDMAGFEVMSPMVENIVSFFRVFTCYCYLS